MHHRRAGAVDVRDGGVVFRLRQLERHGLSPVRVHRGRRLARQSSHDAQSHARAHDVHGVRRRSPHPRRVERQSGVVERLLSLLHRRQGRRRARRIGG